MKFEPLADYLDGQGIVTKGQTLFIHYMPQTIKIGALMLGKLTGTPIDPELPGYYKTGFRIIVRHQDIVDGLAMANQIKDALNMRNVELPGMSIRYIVPKHEPVLFPISEGDHLEISINFDAVYVAT